MTDSLESRIQSHVHELPDFPKPGVRYRDITPIVEDAGLFKEIVDTLADRFADREIDMVCGIEARGFIFGAALAYRMGKGFFPLQWAGKLPDEIGPAAFELEYGFNALKVHKDHFAGGRRVLLVDDLLGTGATIKACAEHIESAGGTVVATAVVVEVEPLEGRKTLGNRELLSLAKIG